MVGSDLKLGLQSFILEGTRPEPSAVAKLQNNLKSEFHVALQ